MNQYNAIKVFEQKKVRSIWDEEKETWYYSIIDVVGILQIPLTAENTGIS